MSIIDKVRKTIIDNGLINKGESVLVALSGGSDSVAMLNILYALSGEIGFSLYAAHLNHKIRQEADDDEKFVMDICKKLNIPCFTKQVDVLSYAKENAISTELAGRNLRYGFFEEVMQDKKIDKLATAHNKNDSCESILLHLIRGCGLEGMSGIPKMRDGYIIRPVIELTKKEIEKYCDDNGIGFVVDKTNFKTDYTRNKIRLNIIPMIEEEFNPNFTDTVTENSVIFRESQDFIDNYTKKVYQKVSNGEKILIESLIKQEAIIIKNIIMMHFKKYTDNNQNLSLYYVNEIISQMKKNSSKTVNLPNGISAKIAHGKLYFEETRKETVRYEYSIEKGKSLLIPETGEFITIKEEKDIEKNTKDKIYFYVNGNGNFKVRNRKCGDKFMPCGMKGTKKLSDYFTDLKICVADRDRTAILTYDDEIVWIVGKRADRRFSKGEKLMSAAITGRSSD